MTHRPVLRPALPNVPANIEHRDFFNTLFRELQTLLDRVTRAGPVSGLTLNLANLPTSPTDLRVGDVYIENGHLMIIQANYRYPTPASVSFTSEAPTVSIV